MPQLSVYLVLFCLLDFLLCWCNKAGITLLIPVCTNCLQVEVIQMRNNEEGRSPLKHFAVLFRTKSVTVMCETCIVFVVIKLLRYIGNWKPQPWLFASAVNTKCISIHLFVCTFSICAYKKNPQCYNSNRISFTLHIPLVIWLKFYLYLGGNLPTTLSHVLAQQESTNNSKGLIQAGICAISHDINYCVAQCQCQLVLSFLFQATFV